MSFSSTAFPRSAFPEPAPTPEIVDLETGLQHLIERGFQFVHPRNADGEVLAVVGVRVHDGMVDVVRLHAADEVLATRIPAGEDILEPATVLWQATGSVQAVLEQVLSLPEDHVPGAAEDEVPGRGDAPVNGCWVPGSPGRAKWLQAS
ncbi:hypothetical protein [Amycolatopsis sp. CA-230715]|uniref:hypothetical protein n=1 Tax=Amycolatopsis sp. CA-230715 TaxID=2745196 RepID=UPI001C025396|nr:hypothetical protein [Amycolatopsis sp. CA-230715]QWF80870.1 hypothetical protein HUW46_04295 [Amycolatopsis sp. CA-230715]